MASKDHVEVFLSGFLFARLASHASQACSYQEGLLLGSVSSQVISNVTDMDHDGVKTEKEITVQDFVASDGLCSFYDQTGCVDHQKLKSHLGRREKEFIGWYMIRRGSSPRISMRENAVIKSLMARSELHDNLTFLLITPQCSESFATHQLPYKFFVCERHMSPVLKKVTIVNLGGNNHIGHRYRHRSRLLGSPSDTSKDSMKAIQDLYKSRFVDEKTGSIIQADASYHVLYQTLRLLQEMKEKIIDCRRQVENGRHEHADLRDDRLVAGSVQPAKVLSSAEHGLCDS